MTGVQTCALPISDGSDPDHPEIFRADVNLTGAVDPGNTATIQNVSRSDLSDGTIWASGYPDNGMKVNVTVAPGYKVTVSVINTTTGASLGTSAIWGSGLPITTANFDIDFKMPDLPDTPSNVLVTLNFEKDDTPPEEYELKLTTVGTDSNGSNKATLALTGAVTGSNTIVGTDTTVPVPADGSTVAVGTVLELTTTHSSDHYVEKVEQIITDGGTTTTIVKTANPGDPNKWTITMGKGTNEIKVYFKEGPRMARPYDPAHVPATPTDESTTKRDGWILAETLEAEQGTGHGRIKVKVPTLFDEDKTRLLEDAGVQATDGPAAKYTLYLKDPVLGTYTALVEGTDYTVSDTHAVYPSHNDGTRDYTGYEFSLTSGLLNSQLGYYTLHGGSIYITATDPVRGESDYTEIVILPAYKATLHYIVDAPTAAVTATMEADTTPPRSTTADGGEITGLNPGRQVTVKDISNVPAGYTVTGVVATTAGFSTVNVPETAPGSGAYTYTMVDSDVDLTVAYNTKPWDMYLVTVSKENDDGEPMNDATVLNTTVSMPAASKGTIWTGAYTDNVVRVDATTAPNYYIIDFILTKDDGTRVDHLAQKYANHVVLTMEDYNVNVKVVYSTEPPEPVDLTLEVVNHAGEAGNAADIDVDSRTLHADGTTPSNSLTNVPVNAPMDLTTTHVTGYSVEKVEIIINNIASELLLTDGAVTMPNMPLMDATVKVYYQEGTKTGRPYDPDHSEQYNSPSYSHSDPAQNLSQNSQEGWILAQTVDANHFSINVPALYDGDIHDTEQLVSAYQLYWHDGVTFRPLAATGDNADVAITAGTVPSVTSPYGTLQYALNVEVLVDTAGQAVGVPGRWGGYALLDYLTDGGSIYITAKGQAPDALESDKTEVVIPAAEKDEYSATLRFDDGDTTTPSTAVMTGNGQPAMVNTNGGRIDELASSEVVQVSGITPPAGKLVTGVVVHLLNGTGSVNAVETAPGVYSYTMVDTDVELEVVYEDEDDPFHEKGPYKVAVQKADTDGMPNNDATVTDLDVVIPPAQRGHDWTIAYEGNVVQVDINVELGYRIASVTAKDKAGNSVSLSPLTFVPDPTGARGHDSFYTKLYMPADTDVDVLVTYEKGDPEPHTLTLEMAGVHDGLPGNAAAIPFAAPDTDLTTDGTSLSSSKSNVAPGTPLALTTQTASGYSVEKVQLITGGVAIDIPLTDGDALPIPDMPMADATIVVTFRHEAQTARP